MQLRKGASAVEGLPVPVPEPGAPPNCEPAGRSLEHALRAFCILAPPLNPLGAPPPEGGAPPPEGNVPEGAPPFGGPPAPGKEILTPCFFRQLSNFFKDFLVECFVARLGRGRRDSSSDDQTDPRDGQYGHHRECGAEPQSASMTWGDSLEGRVRDVVGHGSQSARRAWRIDERAIMIS
jgi:hypothetical protein